jgi:hypothetical protein
MAPYIHEDFPINPIAGSGICTQYKLDYTRPAICWDRDDWPDRNAYIYLLTDEERNEINQALYHFKRSSQRILRKHAFISLTMLRIGARWQ